MTSMPSRSDTLVPLINGLGVALLLTFSTRASPRSTRLPHPPRNAFRAAKTALHADTGAPIKLSSKPLRTAVRQTRGQEADAWVAESGFVVRKVGLESGRTKQVYRGHTGPVTSLAFWETDGGREVVVSGSWDKSFRAWDTKVSRSATTVPPPTLERRKLPTSSVC